MTETLTWDHLRSIPADELKAGDRFYRPAVGEAHYVNYTTGKVRGAMGFAPMSGTVFTVDQIDPDGTIHASAGEVCGAQCPSPGQTVLVLVSKP